MENKTNNTILFNDPAQLRLHPLVKNVPTQREDSPEWGSFVDGLSSAGADGIPPIIISPEGLVMDGARRLRAAKLLQWTRIACLERPEWEAPSIIVDSLMGQRSMTRGAKVYLCIPLLEEYVKSSEARRHANLRNGQKTLEKPIKLPNSSNLSSESATALLNRWGISWETWSRAMQVHKLFYEPKCQELARLYKQADKSIPTLEVLLEQQQLFRSEFEPQLLSGEKNLWNILSAAGGRIASEDQPRVDHQLELLFESALDTLAKRASRFGDITEIKPQVRAWLETMKNPSEVEHISKLGVLLYDEAQKYLKHQPA